MQRFAFVLAALAATMAAPEAWAQYDANALARPVRDAVMTARAREADAQSAAERGYNVSNGEADVYLGGWRNDAGNGQGVLIFMDSNFSGGRYRGDFANNAYND